MISLIVAILFGLSITYFAFQNAVGVPVTFAGYQLTGVPLYLVAIFSVLAGITMAWFISAIEGISHYRSIRRKDSLIHNDQKEIAALQEKVHDLEAENARLREDRGVLVDRRDERVETQNVETQDVRHKPSFFERLFPNTRRRYTKQF